MSWTTDCASFLFLRVQQTVIQHCCSRVVSCRKPAKFWQGKGIETDCPLLFVAAAAATFCERWKDGYQPTRTTDIRNVHCLSIIESEKKQTRSYDCDDDEPAWTTTTTSRSSILCPPHSSVSNCCWGFLRLFGSCSLLALAQSVANFIIIHSFLCDSNCMCCTHTLSMDVCSKVQGIQFWRLCHMFLKGKIPAVRGGAFCGKNSADLVVTPTPIS